MDDMPSDEAVALFKMFEESAVSREQIQKEAAIVASNAHRFQIITLKVGPHAGKCIIWLECACEDPKRTRCSAVQYN